MKVKYKYKVKREGEKIEKNTIWANKFRKNNKRKLFVEFRKQKPNEKIYVLIDEYDNFTNGILKGNAEKF